MRERSLNGGRTLIELVFFLCNMLVGFFVGAWGWRMFGWAGLIAGFVVGFLALTGVLFVITRLLDIVWLGRPALPVCRNGKCQIDDYRLVKIEDGEFAYVCRCGLRYRKKGGLVLEVRPDCSSVPYMRWKAFKGWRSVAT